MNSARERVHQAIGEATPFGDDGEDLPDGGVLTGWVMVAEWQGTDGNRWLSKLSSDASGDRGLASWSERGFCNEVVAHWPEGESDAD